MPVRLDRRVRVAGTDLQPGLYQLVLIQREGNQGLLVEAVGWGVNSQAAPRKEKT